jgi:hypothetical protein
VSDLISVENRFGKYWFILQDKDGSVIDEQPAAYFGAVLAEVMFQQQQEIERLKTELQMWTDAAEVSCDEEATHMEVHCTCVPLLRGKIVKQQQEIEKLRDFAERVYRDQFSPGWLHDRAAKLLDLPSLTHGCDDTEEEGNDDV